MIYNKKPNYYNW